MDQTEIDNETNVKVHIAIIILHLNNKMNVQIFAFSVYPSIYLFVRSGVMWILFFNHEI